MRTRRLDILPLAYVIEVVRERERKNKQKLSNLQSCYCNK